MFIAPDVDMKMPGTLMISLRDVHCLSQDVQDPRGQRFIKEAPHRSPTPSLTILTKKVPLSSTVYEWYPF